ncbi:hypothetical protein RMCBS344292_04725 [Rhizopus microsporus]|nr:hypothetical protein RMCBS344292_04725 [Rhizopus microsporus]
MNVYAVLNVGKDATLEEIKKSYRRLALRYHPDKNPQCEEQFRNVNQAYNILSDPKKRRIYDRYGMAGVNMMDTMGPGAILLDPEVEAVILTFFCILSLIFVCIIFWLVFICLKVDSSVRWPWSVVFIPLWIIDGLILWMSLHYFRNSNSMNKHSSHVHDDEDEGEEDEEELLLNEGRYKKSIISRCIPLIECVLIILFQVLVVLYLDGYPVYLPCILAPYYGFEVIHSLFNGKSGWVTRLVILIQLTCIVFYHKDWVIVFIPTYLLGLFYFLKLWRQYRHFARMGNQELAQQAKSLVFAATILYCLLATLFYTVLGLIIARLKGMVQIRLIVILIPIFIIMGIMLCCSGCCLPCMLILPSSLPSHDPEIVDPNRRITASSATAKAVVT